MASEKDLRYAMSEVEEHLILGKYSDAMNLMAQITIDLVSHLTDEALIVSKGYEEDLKSLLNAGIISYESEHNLETLIISGVQSYNGVDIPEEHARKAYEVLSNELNLIFNEDNKINVSENENRVNSSHIKAMQEGNRAKDGVFEYDEDEEPYPGDFSRNLSEEENAPAFMMNDEKDFREKERIRNMMFKNNQKSKNKKGLQRLLAIVGPIVLLLVVIIGVRAVISNVVANREMRERQSRAAAESSRRLESSIQQSLADLTSTAPPEQVAGWYEITGDILNVRDEANTNAKILVRLPKGDLVRVTETVDREWAIITYEGKEAFVYRQYIRKTNDNVAPSAE